MRTWPRTLYDYLVRVLLGDVSSGSFESRKNLSVISAAYGQCIHVLISSTKTYLEQRLDELPPADVVAIEQTKKSIGKISDIEKQFSTVTVRHDADEGSAAEHDARFERYIAIDAQLIAVIPDDFLVARRWVLLDRMRRIAPQKALMEYEGSMPPSLDKATLHIAKAIRADLISISSYMQQLYILNVRREQTLASVKWWLLSRVLMVVVSVALLIGLATTRTPSWAPWSEMPWTLTGLLLVFLTGMTGAVVSISRKFQDIGGQNILLGDPFNELVSLNYSRESIGGSILAGGVFALVAYLMVVSGSTDALGLEMRFFPSLTERRTIVAEVPPGPASPPDVSRPPDQSTANGKIPKPAEKGASGSPVATGTPPAATGTPSAATSAPGTGDATRRSEGGNGPPANEKTSPPLSTKTAIYVERADDNMPLGIRKLSEALGFFYQADILRMMLLAFLAGFAERLVPDSIDRLVRKERAVKEANA